MKNNASKRDSLHALQSLCLAMAFMLLASCSGSGLRDPVEDTLSAADRAMIAVVDEALAGLPVPGEGAARGDEARLQQIQRLNKAEARLGELLKMREVQGNPKLAARLRFRRAMLHTVQGKAISTDRDWDVLSVPVTKRRLGPRDQALTDAHPALVYWYLVVEETLSKRRAMPANDPPLIMGTYPNDHESTGYGSTYLGVLESGVAAAKRQRNSDLEFTLMVLMADMLNQTYESNAFHFNDQAYWLKRFRYVEGLARATFTKAEIANAGQTSNDPATALRRHHIQRLGKDFARNGGPRRLNSAASGPPLGW